MPSNRIALESTVTRLATLYFRPTQINIPPIKTLAKLKEREPRLGVSPARTDIESWIQSSTHMLDDMSEDNQSSFVWRRDVATGEWTEAIRYASSRLLTSRTSVRIPFLREELLPLVKIQGTCFSG
jgi:hypothetical protein